MEKKKGLLLFFGIFCGLFCSFADSADKGLALDSKVNDQPHRKIYAYFLTNYDFGTGNYGIGSFYSDAPEETELTVPFYNMNSIYAGAAANGIYYGTSYLYVDGAPPQAQDLIAIDMRTGDMHNIGPWADDPNMKIQDMAYNYGDSTMYAISYGYEYVTGEDGSVGSYLATALYTIDLESGKMTKKTIMDTAMAYGAIAAGYNGQLYLMGNDGNLYAADKESGEIELLCETPYKRPHSFWSAEVDHTDNTLYWIVGSFDYDGGDSTHLIRFDLNATPVTYQHMGTIGSSPEAEAVPYGLYIPFVLAGEDAPAMVTDLTASSDETGALKATLRWVTPGFTFGGKPLESLESIKILRDGREVAEIPATEVGQAMEWTDENVDVRGMHEYVIMAVNEEGEGEKAYVNLYVGPDMPAKVTDLTVSALDGLDAVEIAWTKSQGGEHHSYVDSTKVTYKIVRYPDSVTIIEGLKENRHVDENLPAVKNYSYAVFACNEIGETSALSNTALVGPAFDLAEDEFACDFSNTEAISDEWFRIDANEDNWNWFAGTSYYGLYQFGEATPALEYMTNPGLNPPGLQDADDYWVSRPFAFQSRMNYTLSFDYRCVTEETLEITVGTNLNAESQVKVESVNLSPSDPYVEFGLIQVTIPMEEKGIRNIAFHLTSPLTKEKASHLQITNIRLEEAGPMANAEEVLPGVSVVASDDEIRVENVGGRIERIEVFSMLGQLKASVRGNTVIGTSGWASGLYLVRVNAGEQVKTFKVTVH